MIWNSTIVEEKQMYYLTLYPASAWGQLDIQFLLQISTTSYMKLTYLIYYRQA